MNKELQETLKKVQRDAGWILDENSEFAEGSKISVYQTHVVKSLQLLGMKKEFVMSCWDALERIAEQKRNGTWEH